MVFSKLSTQAYKEKCYGEVYTLCMDFLKHYVLDFYLAIKSPILILEPDSAETSQAKRLLNLVLFSTLTTLSPILPFTSEMMYLRSGAKRHASVFNEPWPVLNLQKLSVEESLIEKTEVLRLIKRSVQKVLRDEKILQSGHSGYKFKIVIQASEEKDIKEQSVSRTNDFLGFLRQDFEEVLPEILECTSAEIWRKRYEGGEELVRTEQVSMFIQGYKTRLDISFYLLEKIGECSRCLKYVRTDPYDAYCTDCASKVDPRFRDLYEHFFDLRRD